MTRWIDRINEAILRRLSSRSRVSVNAEGVVLDGARQYSYADLERVVAFRQANWVGDVLALALDFGGGRVIVVTESDSAWPVLLRALDAQSRITMCSSEWTLRLVAGDEQTELELLDARE